MKHPGIGIAPLLLLLLLLFASCDRREAEIERTHMFSLRIGRMEDQIDLIQYASVPFVNDVRIVLRDGIFYVSDTRAKKLMQFNSYGDLLSLLYDERVNPKPVLLADRPDSKTAVNRWAVSYPFAYFGKYAVSSDGTVYVENHVEEADGEYDESIDAWLLSTVLIFSPDGDLIDEIGQEGTGGSPFPLVQGLFVTGNEGFVVVSRTITDWYVYWFDRTGAPMYTLRIDPDELPMPASADILSLNTIIPDAALPVLYVKVDYYGGDADDVEFLESAILMFNVRSLTVDASIELPPVYADTGSSDGRERDPVSYQHIGAAAGGYLFCLAPVGANRRELLIVTTSGTTVFRGTIELDDEDALLQSFYVTNQGILAALVVEPLEAQVFVWRFDRVVGEARDEAG